MHQRKSNAFFCKDFWASYWLFSHPWLICAKMLNLPLSFGDISLKQAVRERVEYILVFFHEFNCRGELTRFALHAAMPSNMQMSRHWGTIKRHTVLLPPDLYQTEKVPPKKVRHSRKSLWGLETFYSVFVLILSYNCIKEQVFNVCIGHIAYQKLISIWSLEEMGCSRLHSR